MLGVIFNKNSNHLQKKYIFEGIEEKELIKTCLKHNRAAQYELYQRFAPKMMGVCMRYASSVEEAEDWLQDGFIQVFEKLEQFKFKGSLEGWVRRIIKHKALEHIRKESKNVYMVSVDECILEEPDIDGEINELPPFKAISLIQKLPKGCRVVFNLYAIEGYKHQEVATLLGINVGTSKSQLNRARKLLKEMLHNKGFYTAKK